MEFPQICRLRNLFHINKSHSFPKFHLRVLLNCFPDISLYEKLLVNGSHIINDFHNIEGWSKSNKSSDIISLVIDEIPDQVVTSKTGSNHIDRWIREVCLNSVNSSIKLIMLNGCERNRTCHLVIDSSTV